VFAEIIAAAADYEQSNRTHLMPRQQRQFGYGAAQNWGIVLTGAVPWQTERQPRIFGRRSAWRARRFLVAVRD
jgi:hypothetical protein